MVQSTPSPDLEDGDAKRREILEAASRVFRERGFHRAGMREIAAALGIAVGKLYYHFSNKQALLAYCQEHCLQDLLTMAERAEASSPDPAEQLAHVVVGHLRCLNEGTPGSLAHLEVESLEEPHKARIQELRDRYEARVRQLVARGTSQGTFRPVDPKVTALTILGAVNWSVKWFRPDGSASLDTIADAFADHLVRGLLADARALSPLALPADAAHATTSE